MRGAFLAWPASPFSAILHSMRRLNQFEWRTVLEPLIPFSAILRQDPSQVDADLRGRHAVGGQVEGVVHALAAAAAGALALRHLPARELQVAQVGVPPRENPLDAVVLPRRDQGSGARPFFGLAERTQAFVGHVSRVFPNP